MNAQKVKVLATGTFDLLHKGHIFFLNEAKKHGTELFVIVACDENVKKQKGFFPEENAEIRKKNIENLNLAHTVFVGDENDFLAIPKKISPHVLVAGYDQKIPEEILKKNFPHLHIIRTEAFFPEKYKSSLLRKNTEKKI